MRVAICHKAIFPLGCMLLVLGVIGCGGTAPVPEAEAIAKETVEATAQAAPSPTPTLTPTPVPTDTPTPAVFPTPEVVSFV